MPAPTIVDQSFATATNDTTITIPAPAGLAEHHSLVAYLAAVVDPASPHGNPTGWSGLATEDQIGSVNPDFGAGPWIAMSYTLDDVDPVAADYTFQLLTTAGFGDVPPANETPFMFAHGHLLAVDRGAGGSVASSASDLVNDIAGGLDFGPGPDIEAPPSLMLNFLADGSGPSAAFGTVIADEGFTKIGAYDTTGMTAGDNLGARTISSIGGYTFANWAQLEEVFGTPIGPAASRAAWGVLAR
jgi:hypothetical protein